MLAEAQDLLRLDENSEDLIKPYAFKVDAIDGLRYRVRVRLALYALVPCL